MKIANKMAENRAEAIKGYQAQARALQTPKGRKLTDMVDYLAEKYGAEKYVWGGYSFVDIGLTLTNLNGLKDESLETLLFSFISANPEQERTTDNPERLSRSYTFTWTLYDTQSDYALPFKVAVHAHFKGDSPTCHKVVTGYTEPKEAQPIYKLSCEGDQQ